VTKQQKQAQKILRAAGAGRWGVGDVRARATVFRSGKDRHLSRAQARREERAYQPTPIPHQWGKRKGEDISSSPGH
jgi:hypothetical protein